LSLPSFEKQARTVVLRLGFGEILAEIRGFYVQSGPLWFINRAQPVAFKVAFT
jgi:hypothetical protein